MSLETYYQLLGATASSTPEELKALRRALAGLYHPDRTAGDAKTMAQINVAYDTLTDPAALKKYRAVLRTHFPRVCSKCKETGETYKQRGAKRLRSVCHACHGVGLVA